MQSDREKLPRDLSEDTGWDAWESFLMETDREELVQLLLTRMSSDPAFMRMMYIRYGDVGSGEDETGERIKVYREAVLEEMMGTQADAEYLVSLSERCFSLCTEGRGGYSAVRMLLAVVLTMDEILAGGRFSGEDVLLLEDCMWDAVRMIRKRRMQLSEGKETRRTDALIQEARKVCRSERARQLLSQAEK